MGPDALLPIFQILGTKPNSVRISSLCEKNDKTFDEFSRLDVEFPNAVATAKVGSGAKSEGSLVVSGTKGYIYVPAPGGRLIISKSATRTQPITDAISIS